MARRGGDSRGNSYDRRRQKEFLLVKFGDGVTCPCAHCERDLTFETLTRDRKIPGTQGGRYTLPNLLASCGPCNFSRGDKPLSDTPGPGVWVPPRLQHLTTV